ncbi:MAG: hypothetical protein KDH88_09665 [Chromatiales bacterium]|nr:hypothetical protein [Chromatiales bacterium]
MPHGIDPIVGRVYTNNHGKRFTVLAVDHTNVVIRFDGGARIIMSRESWEDLRLNTPKARRED